MSEMNKRAFWLVVVLVVCGCSALAVQQNVAPRPGALAEPRGEFEEILAVEEQRVQAYRSGDIEVWVLKAFLPGPKVLEH